MKASKIASKIIKNMYQDFAETGNMFSSGSKIASQFPDEPRHMVLAAIQMLCSDGLLTVSYADNEPYLVALNVSAIQQCDESTMLKRGYDFLKEIRSWL